ncbi:cellulase family glycosylhydrolase [Alteromonas oceanisediminis]|uniref:cellulase family glycosylhydrolase n=1 Tax=Alteromonas oceanisediminis TaxID=2836180 RepID=UPI001BDA1025|nr:cellulase family glycosylhydrolase [Alteromonas oceanisediminis]MBT0586818.1 cellulase family glycosylhydrolase [Alteromonas oceanisediminis]
MKNKKAFLYGIASCLTFLTHLAWAGFSVNNGQLVDSNGNPFVMRGVNHAHTWFTSNTQAITDIAGTGANTVRIVLSNGTQWSRNSGSEVGNLIQLCKSNSLICILEVHDSTGYPEQTTATHISSATSYWLSSDIKSAIQGQEDYIIINIANEPFGNGVSATDYVDDHIDAINALRAGGITHTLMVTAGNWGQDWQYFLRDNASTILYADPQQNVIFDVHMYEVFGNASAIQNYMQTFANNGLVLVVGEFGASHNGNNVDEDAIMQNAEQLGFGYLGWSWSGNGPCCTDLDIVNGWNPNNLSSWGNRLIHGANGIKETSVAASVYGGDGNGASSQCTWTDGTVWPMCSTDVGGWGWENSQSCVSQSICP